MTHHQPEKIEALVRDALPGARLRLEWFEEIDSTNTYLLAQPDVDKRVVLTECQTLGRGRRGRRWSAPPSSSVMLSLGWHLGGRSPSGLSLVVGLAIVDALAGLGVQGVGLKWPNDLVTESGKLGGVLVELNGERSVLGMGINVNIPTSSELGITQPFTDLNSMGYLPDRDEIAARLIISNFRHLDTFCQHGFSAFQEAWNALNVHREQQVTVESAAGNLRGRVVGVDGTGALVLDDDGTRVTVVSGEVSLRPGTAAP